MNNSPTLRGLLSDSEATEMLMALIGIPGLSGEEQQVAQHIREAVLSAGAPAKSISSDRAHHRSVFGGLVGNLILKLPGSIRAPRRLLVAHMDTVPICRGATPIQRRQQIVAAEKDTGLGGDNRAGVAVLLSTALSILRSAKSYPPLTFLWTVQEEVGMFGARNVNLSKLGNPKLAYNWDGGAANNVAIGAIGCYRMVIEIEGVAAHAGINPLGGINAIGVASIAIADLIKSGWHGLVIKGRQTGTCNIGVIDGGESTNVVPDNVHLRMEARSHSKAFRDRIVREVQKSFEKACDCLPNDQGQSGRVTFNGRVDYEAFSLKRSEPAVKAAAQAVKAEVGDPNYVVSDGGLDANWLTARGIPTVTLGCGQRNVHTVKESVDLTDYHHARQIALRLATQ